MGEGFYLCMINDWSKTLWNRLEWCFLNIRLQQAHQTKSRHINVISLFAHAAGVVAANVNPLAQPAVFQLMSPCGIVFQYCCGIIKLL